MENNDGNEVPIKIGLIESDPLYSVKSKLLGHISQKTIRVSEDLSEKNMMHFFSFVRFVQFEGDPMTLYKFQFQQSSTAKKSEEDDEDVTFQGTNIPPISIANEKSVLRRIMEQALIQLKKYPTKYEEDIALLETKRDFTFSQRNCVLMRSGEKKVLFSCFLFYFYKKDLIPCRILIVVIMIDSDIFDPTCHNRTDSA